MRAVAHRGPDAEGLRRWSGTNASWALGHTRLAINDLSTAANQPMTNEDDTLVMVFNGEIYNSPELRRHCEAHGHAFRSRSDGEVILHLWEMEGSTCLRRLNGIFAVALASTTTGEVFLARDPLGVKPLVYVERDGELWFASELAALRALDAPLGSHDVVALAQFLTFLWVPDPATPHRGARTLEPGTVLQWDAGASSISEYANVLAVEPRDLSFADACEEAAIVVRGAVERQLLSDVPVGLMASGGIDSSLLWWAADAALARAFTIDWSTDTGAEHIAEDTRAVRGLEQQLGTPVEYLPGPEIDVDTLPPSGDLFGDAAYHLTRVIARAAKERGYKVLLSGQGADEVFGGYRRHLLAPLLGRVGLGRAGTLGAGMLARTAGQRVGAEYAARVLRAAAQPDPFRRYMELCSYSTAVERAAALDCTQAEVDDDVVWSRHREVYDRLPASWSPLKRAMVRDGARPRGVPPGARARLLRPCRDGVRGRGSGAVARPRARALGPVAARSLPRARADRQAGHSSADRRRTRAGDRPSPQARLRGPDRAARQGRWRGQWAPGLPAGRVLRARTAHARPAPPQRADGYRPVGSTGWLACTCSALPARGPNFMRVAPLLPALATRGA